MIFSLFGTASFYYHYKEVRNRLGPRRGASSMDRINKGFDLTLRYVFEPGLNWVLEHPVISVVVVVALVYWSVRGYRIL